MGAKRDDRHGRGEPSSSRHRKGANQRESMDRYQGELGMSRMPLTLLEYEGEIWNVYLSSSSDKPADEQIQLEFERTDAGGAAVRYTRAPSGSVLRALREGQSLDRAALRDELSQALAGGDPAGAADTEGRVRAWRPLGEEFDPERDDSRDAGDH
jgi:hypothetical protein